MNNITYNIVLSTKEVEDVMNTLADKANILSSLQSKIYAQAIEQKNQFEQYQNMVNSVSDETEAQAEETDTVESIEDAEETVEIIEDSEVSN